MAGYRLQEFKLYQGNYSEQVLAAMPDPQAEATFRAAKLDWAEREMPPHAAILSLYRACLQLRAEHAIFQSPPRSVWAVEQLGASALALRWREPTREWLLLFSLAEAGEGVASDAFVQPPAGHSWQAVLASEDRRFGGAGGEVDVSRLAWQAPGAVLLRSG
jgi:maltooligosyltrehalose trehalohydrolase